MDLLIEIIISAIVLAIIYSHLLQSLRIILFQTFINVIRKERLLNFLYLIDCHLEDCRKICNVVCVWTRSGHVLLSPNIFC